MVSIFRKPDSMAASDEQRLRRSEAMLTQLYQEEINPRFRNTNLRGIKVMAVASFMAIILFSGTLFYKFNSFILLREGVNATAGNLESAIQRRGNLFANLINLTLNHAALEHSVFTNTSRMRTEIIKRSGLSPDAAEKLLARIEQSRQGTGDGTLPSTWPKALEALLGGGNAETSLGRLLAVVEQYPNIQSSKTYQQMMESLVDMENLIAMRRVEYHASLREYNTEISRFPWKILADWTNFERYKYFTANSGPGAPLLTRDVYQLLGSLATEGNEPK